MKLTDLGVFDEIFTHIDDVDGHQTSWAVNALYEYAVKTGQQYLVPVEKHHADYCVENRGVERERIAQLTANVEWLKKPILFVNLPDASLLVDGTHRYVTHHLLGVPQILAYMVPFEEAKVFIIEDAPQTTEEKLMRHSHLVELRALAQRGQK